MSFVTVKPLSLEERRLCGLDGAVVDRIVESTRVLRYVSPVYSADLLREILSNPHGQFAYLQFYPPEQRIHVLRVFGENPDARSLVQAFPFVDTGLVVEQSFPGYWYPRRRVDSDLPVLGSELHPSLVHMLDSCGRLGLPSSIAVKQSYCYLMLFPPVVWQRVSEQLGPAPKLREVLDHPLRFSPHMLSVVTVEPGECIHVGGGGYAHTEAMFRRLASAGVRIGGDSSLDSQKPGLAHLNMFCRQDWAYVYEVLGEQPSVHKLLQFVRTTTIRVVGEWSFVRVALRIAIVRGTSVGVPLLDLLNIGYPAWDVLPVVSLYLDEPVPSKLSSEEAMSRFGVQLSKVDKVRLSAKQSLMLYDTVHHSDAVVIKQDSQVVDPVKGFVGVYAEYAAGSHKVKFLPSSKWMRIVVQGAHVTLAASSSMFVDAVDTSVCFYGQQGSSVVLNVPYLAKVLCTAVHADFFSSRENLFLKPSASVVLCAGTEDLPGELVRFPPNVRGAIASVVRDVDSDKRYVPPVGLSVLKSNYQLNANWGVVSWNLAADLVAYSSAPTGSQVRCSMHFDRCGEVEFVGIGDYEAFDYDYDPAVSVCSDPCPSVFDESFSPSQLGDGVEIVRTMDACFLSELPPWSIAVFSDFVQLETCGTSVGLSMSLVRVVLNNSSRSEVLHVAPRSFATACLLSVREDVYAAVCGAMQREGYLLGSVVLSSNELRVSMLPHGFSIGADCTHADYAYLAISYDGDPWSLLELGARPTLESVRKKIPLSSLRSQLRRTSSNLVVVENGMGKLGLNEATGKIVGFS